MSWLEVITTGIGLLGGFLAGHKRAKKVATTTAQVLTFARDVAYSVASLLRSERTVDIVNVWARQFATMLHVAGIDPTAKQEAEALREARDVFAKLGDAVVDAGAAKLTLAAHELRDELVRIKPLLDRMKAEDRERTARLKHQAKTGAKRK